MGDKGDNLLGDDAKLLAQIVENLPHMIFLKDAKELRFVRFNRAGEALLGYDRKELLGKNDHDFFPKEEADFFAKKDREVLDGGELVDIEEEPIHTRNLGERVLHTKKVPILDENGDPIYLLGISEDITEILQTRRELSNTQAELDASRVREMQKMELLGVVAGGVAHDFNNLLVGILGNAGLLLNRLDDDPKSKELAAQIEAAANRAAELTGQMLAYSGRGRFLVEALDVSALVAELASLIRASLHKSATLEMTLEDDAIIEADASRVRQLVMNLLTNASDSLEGRPGNIHVSIQREELEDDTPEEPGDIGRLRAGSYVTIEVRDTGIGMSPEILERVFEPYFSTKATGHGLGLAAAVGIVEAHSGALRLRSIQGEGTAFRVSFPFHEGAVRKPEPVLSRDMPTGVTVLVIDDEAPIRRVVQVALDEEGASCVCAPDGPEGIAAFSADPDRFSVVLLDMSMPRMDGRSCLQELRAIRPHVPVVLSSGYDESANPIATGPDTTFLQKPYAIETLIDTLRNAIRDS
jgi:two-component system cell cycle sensor histidine kinase/response regulator CckA